MEAGSRYLEGGVEPLLTAEPAYGDVDLPFIDALAALEELLELLPNALRFGALPEEPLVERLLQVLARPLRHQLRPRRRSHCALCLARLRGFFWRPQLPSGGLGRAENGPLG